MTKRSCNGEETTEDKTRLQAFPKTVSDGAYVTFCGCVPQPGSSDRKSSVADGWTAVVANEKLGGVSPQFMARSCFGGNYIRIAPSIQK